MLVYQKISGYPVQELHRPRVSFVGRSVAPWLEGGIRHAVMHFTVYMEEFTGQYIYIDNMYDIYMHVYNYIYRIYDTVF